MIAGDGDEMVMIMMMTILMAGSATMRCAVADTSSQQSVGTDLSFTLPSSFVTLSQYQLLFSESTSTSNADKAPYLRLTPLIHFNFQAAQAGERSKADRPCRYEFAHFRSSVSLTAAAATDPFLQITSIYFSLPLLLFLLLFLFFSRASSSLRFVTELRSSTLKLQHQRRPQQCWPNV